MSETSSSVSDERAASLLRVAAYLSQPQRFMAVADARAEMRRTLKMAEKGIVILTTHGEPEAAVVPFDTLEDIRRALMQLLASAMEASFASARERARSDIEVASATGEEELDLLIGEAIRTGRRRAGTSPKRRASRR